MGGMTTLIGSTEAAATLGVSKPTLYAYVSRGMVSRRTAIDGRTSLYDRAEIETLARRGRRRAPTERPSIDVRIATAVTRLDDDSPAYRGVRVLDLLDRGFEEVAELVMTGSLRVEPDAWRPDTDDLDRVRTVVEAAGPLPPVTQLALAAIALREDDTTSAAPIARRLVSLAPSILGGPADGSVAERLTAAWAPHTPPELVRAVETALVLLADHELATSTLAVRVAASVRTAPALALATGLHAVAGRYHGAASEAAAGLFAEAARSGAGPTIERRLRAGERLPGFGHSVYRDGDPRFRPLLDRVLGVPAPARRLGTVGDVVAEAGRAIGHLPNIDLALGALTHVAGLPTDAPIFAVARIAGWSAHHDEEIGERPVRFRGLARER